MLAFPVILLWLCSVNVAAPTVDSTHTAVHQFDKRGAECYPFERLDTVDIDPDDCVSAIRDIPTTRSQTPGGRDAVTGNFGNRATEGSAFKLPRHFARGSCMIGVTMVPAGLARKDKASWNEIATKAAGIVSNCLTVPGPARRGGSDTAGERNQIHVEIFKHSPHLDFMVPLNDFMNPPREIFVSPAAAKLDAENCRYKVETVHLLFSNDIPIEFLTSTGIHHRHPTYIILTMLILPIILLLVAVTIAAPTADLSVLHRLQKRAPMCYDANLTRWNLLNAQECIAAMNMMPRTQVPGASAGAGPSIYVSPDLVSQFSSTAPDGSPFKLPRSFTFGRCTVGVSMVSPLPHRSEQSSWNQIARNTVDLVRECVARPTSLGRGGTTKAGRSDGILIEVFGLTLPYSPRVSFVGSTRFPSVGSTPQGAIQGVHASVE